MQAAVDNRRHAHATREHAVSVLRALSTEEETAAAALAASKQREAAHARDVAQALAAHASALQVMTSARQNAARLVKEVDRASEQKAIAVASKNFKMAADLTNSIRELSKEQEAAEASLQALSGRLTQADERVRDLQSHIGARAADVQACARVAALARWRRLRAELQTAQQDEQLRADADALAAEHGFSDADA
jgi:chromosome segregation ATPase